MEEGVNYFDSMEDPNNDDGLVGDTRHNYLGEHSEVEIIEISSDEENDDEDVNKGLSAAFPIEIPSDDDMDIKEDYDEKIVIDLTNDDDIKQDPDVRNTANNANDLPPPSTSMNIMRVAKHKRYQADVPHVNAFIVNTGTNPVIPFRLWTRKELREDIRRAYPFLMQENFVAVFAKGIPVLEIECTIHTCGGADRPAELYRVVHEDMYGKGMVARGQQYNVDNNPARFHRFMQKHFFPSARRNKSPFMSATSDRKQISEIMRRFERDGFTPSGVIHFRTTGPGWDHDVQRLWHVASLGRMLGQPSWAERRLHRSEYLLEHSIPEEAVIHYQSMDDLDDDDDVFGDIKLVPDEPSSQDDSEGEEVEEMHAVDDDENDAAAQLAAREEARRESQVGMKQEMRAFRSGPHRRSRPSAFQPGNTVGRAGWGNRPSRPRTNEFNNRI